MYLIITIAIIHFALYYFNFDFDVQTYINIFYKNNSNGLSQMNKSINDSINELKTLNECINNGEINASFS